MAEPKFTPGPWKAFFGTENNRVLIGIGEEETGEGIADCGDRYWRGKFGLWRGNDEEAHANAHLIAAAPDLYAALEYFANCSTAERSKMYKPIMRARAALAKARGEWQPIETAPKDGTPILCAWEGQPFDAAIMHYEGGMFGVLTHEMDFIVRPDAQPTHWMPLPKPPKG